MTVSVLLPTRGRPQLLARSVRSLRSRAEDAAEVEICIAVDPDDHDSLATAKTLKAEIIDVVPERYGYHQLHRYVNRLVEASSGEWLLLWNDDALMVTEGWEQVINDAQPGVLHLRSNHHGLNVFPAVHRVLTDAMGHFSLSPHNDSWVDEIGNATNCCRDVAVEAIHDRFDLTGNNDDAIFTESQAGYRTAEYHSEEMRAGRARDIEAVRAALRA